MIPELAHVAAWFVAWLLTASAIAKLRDPQRAGFAAQALGVPIPATKSSGRAIAAIEVLVAASLAVAPQIGSLAAALLFGFFTVLLVRTIQHGRRVECFCFGDSGKTVDWRSAARSTSLGVVALAIWGLLVIEPTGVTDPSSSVVEALTGAATLGVVALITAVLQLTRDGLWLRKDLKARFSDQ